MLEGDSLKNLSTIIFGFRSSSKSVLIGMLAGLIAVTLWRVFVMQYVNIDSILPGVFCNCIFLFGSHYFLKEEGGWVCTKNSNNEYTEKNTYYSIIFKRTNISFITLHNNLNNHIKTKQMH